MDTTFHEDYFISELFKRYKQLPEETKKKLDKLSRKIHLLDYNLFFDKYEDKVQDGDIFVIQIIKGKFLYGRVLSTNAKIIDEETKIQAESVILLYKQFTTELKMPSKKLMMDDLLLRPQLAINYLFSSGFAKIIGNIPLSDQERNIDIGFLNRFRETIIDKDNNIKVEDHIALYNIYGDIIVHKPKYISTTKVQGLGIIHDIARELIIDSNILGEEYIIPTNVKKINIKKLMKEDAERNKIDVDKYKTILENSRFYKNIDGFYIKKPISDKAEIVIYEQDTDKYVKYINTHNIESIIVHVVEGGVDSLDFLLDLLEVKHLFINGKLDCSPIYKLKKLKSLCINGESEIRLDKIEGLEYFSTSNPDFIIINKEISSLKTLIISSQDIKSNIKDLQYFKYLNNLDTLVLEFTSIQSLNGIGFLKNLKFLTLSYNRKLFNIDALSEINSLKHIKIEHCNNVQKLDSIGQHKELIYLGLNYMKKIQSIQFISKLKNLKSFVLIESNVIDGDMTSIINLQEAAVLQIRKHYYKMIKGDKVKVKESDFSYGDRDWGDEDIDAWRRLGTSY